MSHHELDQEQIPDGAEEIPTNIIELRSAHVIELNGLPVKLKGRVPLQTYAVEIGKPGEVIEISTVSSMDLQLFGQVVYPASHIYTDGIVTNKIPKYFSSYPNGTDQLNISSDATYLAWSTDTPADDIHLELDSQGRPFHHHLVTTRSMADIRKVIRSGGNHLIKFVNSPFGNMLRARQSENWDPKNIG